MSTVNILLTTYNGARFLEAQLASFLDQDHTGWRLWVADDGSRDDTREILAAFARAHPDRVAEIRAGPGRGSAANFLTLLQQAPVAGSAVAFSDQDDVWMPHKLSRALEELGPDDAAPAVYASRTLHTDAALAVTQGSRMHRRPLGFGNALVQNVLAGNTIVLSPAMTDLMRATLPAALRHAVPFHDWWVYLVASATAARIVNDEQPGLYYRQHGQNAMGAAVVRRMERLRALTGLQFAEWIDRNTAALDELRTLLTPGARALLDRVVAWRARPPLNRPGPRSIGLYRQTRSGDVALRLLARGGRL